MRIPSYYCPNCRTFKKSRQVTNVDAWDYGNCKCCGTHCVPVQSILLKLIEKEINSNNEQSCSCKNHKKRVTLNE